MGNLTRDPELKVLPKGTPVCQFSIAINRKFKLESGESREEVLYVDIIAWEKRGETIAKWFKKGDPIYIEGRLQLEQWEDKNTKEKRSRMKVVLDQFQFLSNKSDGGQQSAPEERHAPPPRAQSAAQQQENLDEDVPF